MTGFGEARHHSDALALAVEIRAVNNRHLKVTVRGPEPYPLMEAEVEKVVRRYVRRGTLQIQIRVERQYRAQDFRINPVALASYVRQIEAACDELGAADCVPHLLGQVVMLPGVAPEPGTAGAAMDEEWPIAEKTLCEALERLQHMRREEGAAMARELLGYQGQLRAELARIRAHLPSIAEAYRKRLLERVQQAVLEAGVLVKVEDLIREVALFADRSDVAEEATRLDSHLDQFAEIVTKEDDSPGRKLEFVTQEMFREANTIGSKAGDVTVSRHVVEMKSTLEKIRELVQNVE
jgi:uncharacterized protein (TIGR00255 family)